MKKLRPFLLLMILLVPALVLGAQQGTPAPRLEITGVNATEMPVVTVTANVYDSLGQPVLGLTAGDFALTGELVGQAQITNVENITDNNLPFAVVLVIDVSTSMAGEPIDNAKQAARAFVENIGENDPVAIMTFGSRVRVVQDYTTDKNALMAVIDSVDAAGETALYQGAYEAIQLAAQSPTPRRAVILLSDGAEYGGRSTVAREDAAQEALVSGVPIYTIGLGYGFDRTYLLQLSRSTNASNYESPTSDQLTQIYTDLAAKLRSQYVITLDAPLPLDGTEYDFGLQVTTPEGMAQANATLRAPIPVPVVQLPHLDQPLTEPTEITATVLHDDPLTNVSYQVGDGETVSLADEPYTFTIDPFDYPPGDTRLSVTATDADGDTGADVIDLTIGALPSRISLSPDLTTLGAIDQPQTITVDAQGQTATTDVSVSFNGGEPEALSQPYSFTIDPLQFASGDNTVTVSVTNEAGVTAEQTFNFSVAALPPQITVIGLQDGQSIDTPVKFMVEVTAQGTVDSVVVQAAGNTLEPASDGSYTIDPMSFAPGANAVNVNASANGLSNATQINFIVAALPPVISIDGLSEGETLSADRDVTVDVTSQTPVARVTFSVDGDLLDDQSSAPFGVTLHVLDFAPGAHTLRVIAGNNSGQSATLDVPFSIAPEPAATATATAIIATQAAVATATQQVLATATAVEATNQAVTATQQAQATAVEATNQAVTATQQAQATATQSALDVQATQNLQATQVVQQTATEVARATDLANNLATLQAQMTATATADQATQVAMALIATQNVADLTATQNAQATLDAQATATAAARATELADNLATLQAQMTATATVQQATATRQALVEATGNARATEQAISAVTGTAVAQQTEAFVSTQAALDQQATQAGLASATQNAQVTATQASEATQNARATIRAAAAVQAQLATRDTLATSNAQARIDTQATQDVRATRNAIATATAEARATANAVQATEETATQTVRDATATQQAQLVRQTQSALDAQATQTTANEVATQSAQQTQAALESTATQVVRDATATREALEATATQVSQQETATAVVAGTQNAVATAEQGAQQTVTAQTLSDSATGTAAANATVRANLLATDAQATSDMGATSTADAQGTLDTRLTAVGPTATASPVSGVAQAGATETSTPQPSPTLTEIQAEQPPASSNIAPIIILIVVIIVIVIVVIILARGRSSTPPPRR